MSAILYDLDGTLVDSGENLTAVVNRTRASYGLPPLDVGHVVPCVGDGARRLVERTLLGCIEPDRPHPGAVLEGADPDEVFARFMGYYAQDPIGGVAVLDGVQEALEHWHARGVVQAVITNKPHRFAERLVEALGWAPIFTMVLGRGATIEGRELRPKPDPDPVETFLQLTGVAREATWMVGDGVPDVRLAGAAGIRCVAITGGFTPRERLLAVVPPPTVVVETFREADAWLRARSWG